MRKLFFIVAIVAVGYKFYYTPSSTEISAYDEAGNPIVLIFTANECGKYCESALSLLDDREIKYKQINLSDGKEAKQLFKQYGGGRTVPVLVVGKRRIDGYNHEIMVSALLEEYGWDALTEEEEDAMRNHFDYDGNPRIVMYGVDWCGYCKKAQEYFENKGVDYEELNIETDMVAKQHYDILGGSGVPLIYVGFKRIQGFNSQTFDEILELW